MYPLRSVATHNNTTNNVKNNSDEPKSFSATITTTLTPHANMTGKNVRISGNCTPAMRLPPLLNTSRCSAKYPAKKMAKHNFANSPG
jgi:hypothetical protein